MKAKLVTITLTAVVPETQLPEGLTLAEVAYRACTGLMSVQTLNYRARPATREECEKNAEFLADWSKSLAEFEAAMEADNLPAIQTAGNFGRTMQVEPEGRSDG